MKRHIHIIHEGHTHKADYKCMYCSKLSKTAADLRNHIHKTHQGHKDYKCPFCIKPFLRPGDLKRHINRIHENVKDYKCDYCEGSVEPYSQNS